MNGAVDLRSERCQACHRDSLRVSEAERPELLAAIPEWTVTVDGDAPRLERIFPFRHYRQALAFTQRVGEMAEDEDHHPVILTEARRVTIAWWTTAIAGLHRNDFIMAAKTDAAFALVVAEGPKSL